MNPFLTLGFEFLVLLGEACVFFALCWLIAKKIENWSIVDVAWSYGFALGLSEKWRAPRIVSPIRT